MLWNSCLPCSYWQNFSLKRSLSVPGQKEKEKDGAQNNFPFSRGEAELWNSPLCRHRDVCFSQFKKEKRNTSTCLPTNTKTNIAVAYTDKMGECCIPACVPCRFSCVSQAQLKEMSAIAIPHHEHSPLRCGGRLWMQSGGRGRTIPHSATLAAFSGGTHSVGSDLLCNNTESRAVRFDLDKCAALSLVTTIQDQIEGQHLFTHHWAK